ncbi:hypothetical protein NKH53_31180 [Mesorhizobium australicum]|uniref:hypothetical protein n=1 Tax=Mesorhizobium australicum TaxID=536018 RepID=UPI00333D9C3C
MAAIENQSNKAIAKSQNEEAGGFFGWAAARKMAIEAQSDRIHMGHHDFGRH